MKILLLGKNGQVGWELQRSLAPLGDLTALGHERDGVLCGDLTDSEALAKTIMLLAPDVIVNAAAYTAVDKAESEPGVAQLINATAPGVMAEAAFKLGALLVHYSTDYVFNGSGTGPWHESNGTAPLSVYGQTKLEGEQHVVASGCRHLIFRTSWVYAARGGNFAKTMLRLAAERESLSVVQDQIGAPTGADLIADVTAHAISRACSRADLLGIYHLAASGETSWYDYARYVLQLALQQGLSLKTPPEAVVPVRSCDYKTAAPRPLNSRLDTQKLTKAFGLTLPNWQNGVARMFAEISEKKL